MSHPYPSRRQFIKWTGGTLAALTLPACAEDEEQGYQKPRDYNSPVENPSQENLTPQMMDPLYGEVTAEEISDWEANGVLTPNEPGEWADKIVGHYPMVKKAGDQVTIIVPHAMDEDHYIEAIYLKGSGGEVVASKRLSSSDEYAIAEFTVSENRN